MYSCYISSGERSHRRFPTLKVTKWSRKSTMGFLKHASGGKSPYKVQEEDEEMYGTFSSMTKNTARHAITGKRSTFHRVVEHYYSSDDTRCQGKANDILIASFTKTRSQKLIIAAIWMCPKLAIDLNKAPCSSCFSPATIFIPRWPPESNLAHHLLCVV